MADSRSRVATALNFLTGEGISYHPDGIKHTTLEALIVNDNGNDETMDDSSSNESDNEGFYNCIIKPHPIVYIT